MATNPYAMPTATPDPSSQMTAPPTTGGPQDTGQFQQNFLYNTDDPGGAFNNALRASGYNPNSFNPYMAYMRRAAPGLALAYQTNAAQGMYGDPMATSQGQGQGMNGFGQYLQQSLAGSNGGVRAQLQHANSQIPQIIQQYRGATAGTDGSNLQNINPYLYSLGQQFSQNNGQGTTGAYAAYNAPYMSQNLASAYGTGLEQNRQNAMYQYAQNPSLNGDLWTYLLGM